MLPRKYIKDLESSARRNKWINQVLISSAFLLSFLAFGPLLHEAAHVSLLQFYGCAYNFSIHTSLFGLFAEVKPLCSPTNMFLIAFYSVGYLTTLVIGTALNIAASIETNYSQILASLGTGTLLSVILTIGAEGDIINALSILGMNSSYSSAISLFITLGVLSASLKGVNIILERQE